MSRTLPACSSIILATVIYGCASRPALNPGESLIVGRDHPCSDSVVLLANGSGSRETRMIVPSGVVSVHVRFASEPSYEVDLLPHLVCRTESVQKLEFLSREGHHYRIYRKDASSLGLWESDVPGGSSSHQIEARFEIIEKARSCYHDLAFRNCDNLDPF